MITLERKVNLGQLCRVENLSGVVFTGESGGHQFVITGYMGDTMIPFEGSVSGQVRCPDGTPVQLTTGYSQIDDYGRAVVKLAANCYAHGSGPFGIIITHVDGNGNRTVIYAAAGFMHVGEDASPVDPESVINVSAIQAIISDMQDAIDDCENAAAFVPNIIAPEYSSSSTYGVGDYVTHDGKFYRCIVPVSTAGSSWGTNAGNFMEVTVSGEMFGLTNAFNEMYAADITNTNAWTVGSLKAADGTTTSSSSRLRTNNFINVANEVFRVKAKTGYEFLVYAWNNTSGNYIGCLKTSGVFDTTSSNYLWLKEYNIANQPGLKFKVVLRNAADTSANMDVSEAVNCLYTTRYVNDDAIAPEFNSSSSYAAGDYTLYETEMYRFTAAHTGAWTGSDTVKVSAGDEIASLKRTDVSEEESIGNEFEAITGNRAIVFKSGCYRTATSTIVGSVPYFADNATRVCAMVKYTEGETINVHIYGMAGTCRAYYYCDSNMSVLSGGYADTNTEYNGPLPTPPSGTAYVLLNNNLSNLPDGYFAYKGTAINSFMEKAILATTAKSVKLTAGSDLNSITTPGSYTVANSTTAAQISNIPITSVGGRLIVFATSSSANYFQMYFPATGSPNSYIRYTTGSWCVFDLSLMRIAAETDASSIINTRLSSAKTVHLGPYDYYVTGISMPSGTSIIGSGPNTRIILMDSVTTGAAITMGSRCSVSNLSVVGSLTDIEFDTSTFDIESISLGTRHGILWLGEATGSSSDANQHYYGSIDNVRTSGFTGGGIVCENTGYGTAAGVNATNCIISNCGAGIDVSYWCEYNRFVNINSVRNLYGCINNGGNNIFCGCNFSSDHVGFYINGGSGKCVRYNGDTVTGKNMGHGSAVGCTINHTGFGNDADEGYAVYCRSNDSGFTFDGCQFFHGRIFSRGSAYIMFGNGNFGNNIIITIYTPGTYIFNMCYFRGDLKLYPYNANTGEKWTTFNSDGNLTRFKFLNCYNSEGTLITVQSASEATEAADNAE